MRICINALFSIVVVKELLLPLIRGVDKGDYLRVVFERGQHVAETKEIQIKELDSDGNTTIVFNQHISLDVTLYKDSSGHFQVSPFIYALLM